MTPTSRLLILLSIGAAVGGLMGAGGALALSLLGGLSGALVPVVLVFAALSGSFGGLLSASATALLGRGSAPTGFVSSFRTAVIGSTIGGVLSYLLLFARQDQQSPVVMVGGPALVLGVAFGFALRGNSATANWRRFSLLAPDSWLVVPRFVWVVGAAVLALSVVIVVALVLVPMSISATPLSVDFAGLDSDARREVSFRLAGCIAISVVVTIFASFRRSVPSSAAHPTEGFVTRISLVVGCAAVNVGWLSASVSAPLSVLYQREAPLLASQLIVTAVGWISVIVWLALAYRSVRVAQRNLS